jgi:soluble lytic murein transglycosylase-like protein
MFSNIIKSTRDLGRSTANRSAALATIARDTVSGFITTTHHALMVLGIGAIAALAFMFVRPEITDHLKALSPFTSATIHEPDVPTSELAALMDTPPKSFAQPAQTGKALREDIVMSGMEGKYENATQEQAMVAGWISRRYHVARNATQMLVSAAYKTADELQLDPLLILAVAAIESGFNPFAESAMGAQGLMQVMSKVHHEKFRRLGGEQAALNPVANIKVGALILKDYVVRGGSVEAGLKMYVGAGAMASDSGYGSRVLAEYHRLKEVAAGKSVPATVTTTASKIPQKAVGDNSNEQKKTAVDEDQSA